MLQEALNNPDGKTKYAGNATVVSAEPVKFNQKTGKPYSQVVLNDGEEQKVKIFSDQDFTQLIGQRLSFNVGGYVSTYDNLVYFSGFWQQSTQVRQGQPPQAPVRPPAAPQMAKPASKPDWDAISRGKVRHGVVCAQIENNGIASMPAVADIEFWVGYIMTGVLPKRDDGGTPF